MELKKTITSIFFVPTLGIDRAHLKENGFINGYVSDLNKDVQYENCIYLLFHPRNLDKFKEFLDNEYERTKSIVDDYDYEEGFVVVVYELDKQYDRDFALIKQSKYSKTSKHFQTLFPKIIKLKVGNLQNDQISLQYRIFNKTEDLKQYWEDKLDVEFDDDVEYWQGWIEENEMLNSDKLKEQYV